MNEKQGNLRIIQSRWILLIVILFLSSVQSSVNATTFDEMLKGFLSCKHKDVYVDIFTGEAVSPYFKERNLKPYKVEGDFAKYFVKEIFYGLPVDEILVPRGTWSVHELYIDLPIEQARKILKKRFKSDFKKSNQSEAGNAPELFADRDRLGRSIFSCQDTSSGI